MVKTLRGLFRQSRPEPSQRRQKHTSRRGHFARRDQPQSRHRDNRPAVVDPSRISDTRHDEFSEQRALYHSRSDQNRRESTAGERR